MKALVAAIPAHPRDTTPAGSKLPHLICRICKICKGRILTPTGATAEQRREAVCADSPDPTLQKLWAHTVKHARQGSAIHRQTLALLDRNARLAIEAACGPWRS